MVPTHKHRQAYSSLVKPTKKHLRFCSKLAISYEIYSFKNVYRFLSLCNISAPFYSLIFDGKPLPFPSFCKFLSKCKEQRDKYNLHSTLLVKYRSTAQKVYQKNII
uniref:Uncharacterized protein n=1 Tax=Sphaerodactylus townsendi TaxID=933632 RepID=A0ACB8FF45_9SAUR